MGFFCGKCRNVQDASSNLVQFMYMCVFFIFFYLIFIAKEILFQSYYTSIRFFVSSRQMGRH